MSKQSHFVVVGKLGAPHGIKGWIKLFSFTEPSQNIFNYQPLYIQPNTAHLLPILEHQSHPKGHFLISIAHCTAPEQATFYTNQNVYTQRSQFPPSQTPYRADLEGLTVYDQLNQKVGTVAWIMETGANDVLIIQAEKQRYAVPYIATYIKTIDIERQHIIIDRICLLDDGS